GPPTISKGEPANSLQVVLGECCDGRAVLLRQSHEESSAGWVTVAQRSAILSPSKRHMTNPRKPIFIPDWASVQRQWFLHTTLSPSAIRSSIVRWRSGIPSYICRIICSSPETSVG